MVKFHVSVNRLQGARIFLEFSSAEERDKLDFILIPKKNMIHTNSLRVHY